MSQTNSSTKLRMMIVTALFAAIIAVLAQVAIPMPLGVPITGQTLAIGLAATILGSRYGTLSAILYLIIGAIGVPVDRKSTRLNSSHVAISYAVFCLKKKNI